jgi:hypothetical protein
MKIYLSFLILFIAAILSSCCDFYFADTCELQTTERTVTAPFTFTYEVNTRGSFIEAHQVKAADVLKALKEPVSSGEVKKIEIQGVVIDYVRLPDNIAGTLNINAAVVDNTTNVILMKEVQALPLYDVPILLNINEFLNKKGVDEIKKILKSYVEVLNNDGFSVLLAGKGFPDGSLTHFTLNMTMTVTVVYEVCEWLPLGLGMELCE